MHSNIKAVGIPLFLGALAFSANSFGAISEKVANRILNLDCSNISSSLPKNVDPIEQKNAESVAEYISEQDALRYFAGDDSLFTDYYEWLINKGNKERYSDSIGELKGAIISDTQRNYVRALRAAKDKIYADLYKRYSSKNNDYKPYQELLSFCQLKELTEKDDSRLLNKLKVIVGQSKAITRQARVGHFTTTINDCHIKELPLTGNSFTEPKQWPGSRFLVVDVSFKNEDSEGRLPIEGSLIINYLGRELRYDVTETILQDGYGIYFKSVNPLLSMPTKIVYRVPSEVSGEVFWEPGRNSEGKRLWCTFIAPES